MRSPATTIWAALLAGTAIAAIGQDTCGWTGSGVDPTNWMEPTNWSCSGGAWPGDCPGDHARLDAGPPVDVTIPAGLVLGDIGVTRSGDVVRAGAGSLNVDNILGAGAFDATVATPATVNNDVMVGTFLAPSASINVTGSFVVADSFDHNGGGVNLLAGPAALRGAPSPGFATLNVQSAYTLAADTRAAIVAVTVGGNLNVDDHVLTIGTSLDITFATGFGFFGGSGTVVLRDGASWITGGAQLTPDNGVVVFEGGGPPIPAETWGHVEVAGARSAGNALMMQALTIPAGGSFDTNSFDLTVSPFGVAGGGTLVTAPPSAVNIDGGITVANLVHNDNPISLIGPGPIGAGLTFYGLDLNSGEVHDLEGSITVANDLNFNTGGIDVTPNNHTVTVGGDWNNAVIGFAFQEGTVILAGDSACACPPYLITNGEFHHLDVQGDYQATTNIFVLGNLNIDGVLDLGLNNLFVGP